MAQPIQNEFTRYKFDSIQEEQSADILPSALLAKLHNMRLDVMMEKINLNYDITNPLQNVQAEAHATGQLSILNQLINAHYELIEKFNTEN